MAGNASTQAGYDRDVVATLVDAIEAWRGASKRRLLAVGLSALQGSGKTTLARQIARAGAARGIVIEVLALDDFYLGRRARLGLARDVHPLLATRGVPGTHDVAQLARTLSALAHADAAHPVAVPRFDKGLDTRRPPSKWRNVRRRPDVVLLEGWCVGVGPETANALARPCNALERDEDRACRWRRFANDALVGAYARLWRRLDRLIVLQAPGFDIVRAWRAGQERALLRRHAPRAMTRAVLDRFLMHYERLSRHALVTLPRDADLVVELDAKRRARGIRRRA